MRYPLAGGDRHFKWYYLVVIALGLAAIVALVIIVLRSGWLSERLRRATETDAGLIKDELD